MTRQILFIVTLILTGCSYLNTEQKRSDKVETYKRFFYENQKTFDQIVERISNNTSINTKTGQRIEPKEFDELTNKQLRRLNIQFVEINKTNCRQLEIEFATSWTEYPIGQMYLSKDCLDNKSTKDSYWTDGNFIEVWGLGNNWTIWVDSDAI